MGKLRKLFSLSFRDSGFLLLTWMLLAVIRMGLFFLPFRVLLRILKTISRSSTQCSPDITDAMRRTVWAVQVSSCYTPGGAKCLARALTTKVLLSWWGYGSELRIGVAKGESGSLQAHAWLEYHGQIVIGQLQDLSRYIPLPSIEGLKL